MQIHVEGGSFKYFYRAYFLIVHKLSHISFNQRILIKESASSLDWAKGVFVCVMGEGGPLGGCQLLVSIRTDRFYRWRMGVIIQQQYMQLEKVGKNFKIIKKIGEGAFGEIYQAINTKTNMEVAVKTEGVNTEHPQLIYQCKLYNYLHNDSSVIDKGIPNVYYCSTEGDFNVLVMDLMGPSLQDLFEKTLRRFSLKTVLLLADQMLGRIEYIHNRLFIHRDIKPDNFCVGLNKTAHKIFILDFGLAKRYIHRNGKHIDYKQGKNLTGTARYASINTHLGIEQSRRDDMECIGYVLMYFLRGALPWQGLKANNKRDKYERIKEKKLTTSIEVLTKGYPFEFTKYLSNCRNLRFDEAPKYAEMRTMFKELFTRSGYKCDYQYDWVVLNEKRERMEKAMESRILEEGKDL